MSKDKDKNGKYTRRVFLKVLIVYLLIAGIGYLFYGTNPAHKQELSEEISVTDLIMKGVFNYILNFPCGFMAWFRPEYLKYTILFVIPNSFLFSLITLFFYPNPRKVDKTATVTIRVIFILMAVASLLYLVLTMNGEENKANGKGSKGTMKKG